MTLLGGFEGTSDDRSGRRRGAMWLVLLMLLLLAAAAYFVLHRVSTGRVPLGTSVEGVPIGGLTTADAEQRLHERLGPDLTRPLTFLYDDQRYPFHAAAAGVAIDYAATVRGAGATDGASPGDLWHYFTGGHDVDAEVTFDQSRFSNALDGLTRRIGRPAIQSTVEFRRGRAVPVYGRTGLAVDHAASQTLVKHLLFEHHAAELPISTKRPYVSRSAVRAALHGFARSAMSGDVRIVIGGHTVVAPPRLFGQAISMIPKQGHLVPLVNGRQLVRALAPVMRTIGPRPRNATVEIVGGRPVVVPAVYGAAYDTDVLASRLPAALRRHGSARVVRVHAAITAPHRSTAWARGLAIHHRLGSFTVAGGTALAGRLDGTLLSPGDSVTLSDRVGAPSRPLGTALFTAALRAGLAIPSYTPSSAYDAELPVGKQMTDVEVRDDTSSGVLVTASAAGSDSVTVTIWSGRPRRVHVLVGGRHAVVAATTTDSTATDCQERAGIPGFTVTVRRRIGSVRGRAPVSTFISSYVPVDAVRCVPATPSASPTASPAASPSARGDRLAAHDVGQGDHHG